VSAPQHALVCLPLWLLSRGALAVCTGLKSKMRMQGLCNTCACQGMNHPFVGWLLPLVSAL